MLIALSAFACISPAISSAQPWDHEQLQIQGGLEFMRLAQERWDAGRYRDAVTFARHAKEIRIRMGGEEEAGVALIDAMASQAIELIAEREEESGKRIMTLRVPDLEALAKTGDADAMFELGLRHARGLSGMKIDRAEAINYLDQAAAAGRSDAYFELGLVLIEERGMDVIAARWAAEGPAKIHAMPISNMTATEFRCFNEAYKDGHEDAKAFVALGLIEQGMGAENDEALKTADEGWTLLRESARAGNAWGQFIQATALAEGYGIPANRTLAVRWARGAANQGLREAKALMAVLLLVGEDAAAPAGSPAEREGWINLLCAAEQGHWLAYYPLGLRLLRGEGIKADPEAGLEWLEKAGEMGHIPAAMEVVKYRIEATSDTQAQ